MADLIDTSAWFNHFFDVSDDLDELIESDTPLFASVLTLFEIKRKLIRDGISREKRDKVSSFIKMRATIIPVDETIAEDAAVISSKNNLSTADAIIYATAISKQARLITCDSDFKKMPGVKIFS
ncbi:MAG: PIN domain-containing protein [Nanoarchaeota archaeon]